MFSVYVDSTNELIGTISGDGSGSFRSTLDFGVNPGRIRIESSFGGSDTANVDAK